MISLRAKLERFYADTHLNRSPITPADPSGGSLFLSSATSESQKRRAFRSSPGDGGLHEASAIETIWNLRQLWLLPGISHSHSR